jgi:ferrous iron transport protein A
MTSRTTPKNLVEKAVSLSTVPRGESVQIKEIRGGHQILSRLGCLGFTPGARLKVVQNYGRGPIIVHLRDTRVALGRGEALKILVEGREDEEHER